MMKSKRIFSLVIGLLLCQSVFASNSWYWGKVTQIVSRGDDGSFEIYLDNSVIKNTCVYERVNFLVDDMGIERTKLAYSMALSAHASGSDWGVVIDLPQAGEACYASSTASQGAGIR